MGKKAVILAVSLILVTVGHVALAQVKVGFGGGFAGSPGDGMTLGTVDMFAETRAAAGLSPRLAWSFLPPLFPTEGPAMHMEVGMRLSFGETLRPHLGLGVGAVFEQGRYCCFNTHPALSAGTGLELSITQSLGIYVRGSVVLAWRRTPYGEAVYKYFPWSVGIHFTTPAVGGTAAREKVGQEP